jgi:hypothetical protein
MKRSAVAMTRIFVAAILKVLAGTGLAQQNFVTREERSYSAAWWVRAKFHALHKEVGGIPVAQLDPTWCKATEYAKDLLPPDLELEEGYSLAISHLANPVPSDCVTQVCALLSGHGR